jgi:REP element-mobilizing transposase RayT
MAKTLAYMVTWTTYGTWLQGDDRKYVKDGQILPPNESLAAANMRALTKESVRLSFNERQIVEEAIRQQAIRFDQQIYALAVCTNHVHLVAEYIPRPIGVVVQRYKKCAVHALRGIGIKGRVWTSGFDKRYCFDRDTVQRKINYVSSHIRKNI